MNIEGDCHSIGLKTNIKLSHVDGNFRVFLKAYVVNYTLEKPMNYRRLLVPVRSNYALGKTIS